MYILLCDGFLLILVLSFISPNFLCEDFHSKPFFVPEIVSFSSCGIFPDGAKSFKLKALIKVFHSELAPPLFFPMVGFVIINQRHIYS